MRCYHRQPEKIAVLREILAIENTLGHRSAAELAFLLLTSPKIAGYSQRELTELIDHLLADDYLRLVVERGYPAKTVVELLDKGRKLVRQETARGPATRVPKMRGFFAFHWAGPRETTRPL